MTTADVLEAVGSGAAIEKKAMTALEVLNEAFGSDARFEGDLSPSAVVMLITGIPKFLSLEEGVGVETAHSEVVRAVERYLDAVEPGVRRKRKPVKTASRGRR